MTLAYLKVRRLKLRPTLIALEKIAGEFLDVFKNFGIKTNPGLLKSPVNLAGLALALIPATMAVREGAYW